ncbi:nitrate reductase [Alicyclobacillus tengchongensis]|nr:nitrate reductase [Alicyclobacillus tengchongensis]
MENRRKSLFNGLNHLRRRSETFNENWSQATAGKRDWEQIYRNRWRFDKVVRSTHGVNCTGSCSWKIHVKDGIITFETQQTDYPSLGADVPEYEPRGCPRGASFSWYEYSPSRVKYPYIRSELLVLWRHERDLGNDPVTAWRNIVSDKERRSSYRSARGKGGFVRTSWDEVTEIIAAAIIHTIQKYGPDRVVGFSPIPAMSQVSYAGGSRFLSLLGGTILSFYDWYADLPPASPQIWGDQTDVPESADWYNAGYFIIWGTNLPMTRTPDAHFMVEARYKGTKVVGVSPDYSEYIKFADKWLPAKAGTDAALAMAMTHVILKEFYVDKETPYFAEYVKQYTDLPFLVQIDETEDGYAAGTFLHAADFDASIAQGDWKTVVWDETTNALAVPKGSLGYRYDGSQQWNLRMESDDGTPLSPSLTLIHQADATLPIRFPYFGDNKPSVLSRHVPVKYVTTTDNRTVAVTTVLDLLMAHTGVSRGLVGDYPVDFDDASSPYTPAWQEAITGVRREDVIQIAREFADNAEKTQGRSMIALGAGTNHWYHSDMIYRAIINLVLLTGCQGVNGGGWAHYVGQEKVRPLEGWSTIAFATDWVRPPRQMNGTSFFYFATDQYRYEELDTRTMGSPVKASRFHEMHPADMNAMAARLGWLPSFPQWTQNSLSVVNEAKEHGATTNEEIVSWVVEQLKRGDIQFAIEDPDNEDNFPRVFFVWRSNLLGSSGKGHEYFLKHLLGASGHVLADEKASWQPSDIVIRDAPVEGKVDLLVDIDFRMTGTGLYSDIVLPAATWYEKHDISSTDMHPFIHPFNPAISPPWETRTDWVAFRSIAETFSKLAKDHLPACDDIVMSPLAHDSADELANVGGRVRDWRKGEVDAIPGRTMPKITIVKRDYPNLIDQMTTLGPLSQKGYGAKGISISGEHAYEDVVKRNGSREVLGAQRPQIHTEIQVAEAILTLSGATNGHRAVEEWTALSQTTGLNLKDVSAGRHEEAYTFADITAQPRLSFATPVWSGLEGEERRYSPFTVNVEFKVPWHTLTGRQHFYVDHEVMNDFGETLPLYRPALGIMPFADEDAATLGEGQTVMVRYLTPHQKWGIHSTYSDNHRMLTLFRGGQTIWMSEEDAKKIGIKDNDWVEVFNRNGAISARAVVTYRLPMGIAMMYHAQDRTVGVPGSQITGDRGGTHNSVTRIIPKPTHMIGGYAQLSYGFNYYGPTGHQRDVMTFVRPLKEVNWLED